MADPPARRFPFCGGKYLAATGNGRAVGQPLGVSYSAAGMSIKGALLATDGTTTRRLRHPGRGRGGAPVVNGDTARASCRILACVRTAFKTVGRQAHRPPGAWNASGRKGKRVGDNKRDQRCVGDGRVGRAADCDNDGDSGGDRGDVGLERS